MAGDKVEGASTLTQQVVRTFFLSREKSYKRKVAEVVRALALERLLTKDEILELYLDAVYLGQQPDGRSVGGVAAAARAYFDVDVGGLSLDQAALLAGIIPAPVAWSPWKNPEAAKRRRDRVLARMVEHGFVTQAEADAAAAKPIALRAPVDPEPRWALYAQWARRYLTAATTKDGDPAARGLRVFTALDPALQTEAEAGVAREVAAFEEEKGVYKPDPLQGASLGLDPATGLVEFAVPGRGREGNQFHRAVQARRQPGSCIKPVAYAAVFSEKDADGHFRYTPADTVEDEPRAFQTKEGLWRPHNSDGLYHPWVTLAKAFAKSMNLATTNLVVTIGPQKVVEMGAKLGIQSPMRAVPSVGLGSSEVTLVELVGALSVVATNGKRVDPSPVRLAVDMNDQPVWKAPPPTEQALDPRAAAMLASLMRGSFVMGTGYKARREFGYLRDVVGKTGTSQQGHDLWFVGVTPRLAVGFWMGHDHGRPLYVIAGDYIAPAWGRMARTLYDDTAIVPFTLPPGVQEVNIDPYSGCKGGPFPVAMPTDQPFPKCRPVDWPIPTRAVEGEGGEGEGGEAPPPAH
jgi:membrane peptidoglycan carboxypeptidase